MLVKTMGERVIAEGLISRCKDNLKKTKIRMRRAEEISGRFWTGKEVKQGCPLSTDMFNFLMADLEEIMKRDEEK